jgi:DNA-binding transcriptional ArsR family regulator
MNSYLARIPPEWRDRVIVDLSILTISPESRQIGEIKQLNSTEQKGGITEGIRKLIDEGINEGVIEGITEGVKESMIQIVSTVLTEQSIRASEIAEKLNKSYKTLERHISILKQLNAIDYRGSNRAGSYELTEHFASMLRNKT